MDLVVIIVLMALVIFFFRKFSSFIYFIGIIDTALRLFAFIKANIKINEIFVVLNKVKIQSSIPSLINAYSSGIFYEVLIWGYIICMCIFLYYVIRTFFRKK